MLDEDDESIIHKGYSHKKNSSGRYEILREAK